MSGTQRASYWSQVISEQVVSGETVAAFCRRRDISQASFYAWRKRLSERDRSMFVPVSVVDRKQPIEVGLPGNVTIRVPCDAEALGVVLDALLQRGQGE